MKKTAVKLARFLGWLLFLPGLIFAACFFFLYADKTMPVERLGPAAAATGVFTATAYAGWKLTRFKKKQEKEEAAGIILKNQWEKTAETSLKENQEK